MVKHPAAKALGRADVKARFDALGEEYALWDVIFVRADTAAEDRPAITLYSKLGTREKVLHFDIAVKRGDGST